MFNFSVDNVENYTEIVDNFFTLHKNLTNRSKYGYNEIDHFFINERKGDIMSEFLQKDDARKNRILEAALVEFADKGYKKASTNTIVREAQVSKGLLFHYFISKKELYIYIYKYAQEVITNEMYEGVNFADRDVLNRLFASTVHKINSYINHPLFTQLFEHHAFIDDEDILSSANYISESYTKLFSNIDYFFFQERINIDRSLDVVKWTIDRISKNWITANNNRFKEDSFVELKEEIEIYLELFRDALYK